MAGQAEGVVTTLVGINRINEYSKEGKMTLTTGVRDLSTSLKHFISRCSDSLNDENEIFHTVVDAGLVHIDLASP